MEVAAQRAALGGEVGGGACRLHQVTGLAAVRHPAAVAPRHLAPVAPWHSMAVSRRHSTVVPSRRSAAGVPRLSTAVVPWHSTAAAPRHLMAGVHRRLSAMARWRPAVVAVLLPSTVAGQHRELMVPRRQVLLGLRHPATATVLYCRGSSRRHSRWQRRLPLCCVRPPRHHALRSCRLSPGSCRQSWDSLPRERRPPRVPHRPSSYDLLLRHRHPGRFHLPPRWRRRLRLGRPPLASPRPPPGPHARPPVATGRPRSMPVSSTLWRCMGKRTCGPLQRRSEAGRRPRCGRMRKSTR